MSPTLLAVGHGSRDPRAQETTERLLDRVRALRPGLRVRVAYVELAEPLLADALHPAAVVVPLLLSNGYHAAVDVAAAATAAGCAAAPALGPHPLLAEALAARLRDAGGADADAVVLGWAGSSQPAAVADAAAAAALLSDRLGRPVVPAAMPDAAAAVARLRGRGHARVAASAYLLAPGWFADRLSGCGADAVAAPLGAHGAVARLVLARFDAAAARAAAA